MDKLALLLVLTMGGCASAQLPSQADRDCADCAALEAFYNQPTPARTYEPMERLK